MQNFDGRLVGSLRINFDQTLETRFGDDEMGVRSRLELLETMERGEIDRLEKLRKESLEKLGRVREARPERRQSVVLGKVGLEVGVERELQVQQSEKVIMREPVVVGQVDVDLRSVMPQATPDIPSEEDFMKSEQSSMEVDIKQTMPNLNMVTSVFAVTVGKILQHKDAQKKVPSLLMKSIIFDKKPTKATQTDPELDPEPKPELDPEPIPEPKPEVPAPEPIPVAPKNVFRALLSMTDGVKNRPILPTYENIGCQTSTISPPPTPTPSPEPKIDNNLIADLKLGLATYLTKTLSLESTLQNLHHSLSTAQTKILSLEAHIHRHKFIPRIEAHSYQSTQQLQDRESSKLASLKTYYADR